jgi:hypothetical protein
MKTYLISELQQLPFDDKSSCYWYVDPKKPYGAKINPADINLLTD